MKLGLTLFYTHLKTYSMLCHSDAVCFLVWLDKLPYNVELSSTVVIVII